MQTANIPPPFFFADSGNFPRPDQTCKLVAVLQATALHMSSLQLILPDHRYGCDQQGCDLRVRYSVLFV